MHLIFRYDDFGAGHSPELYNIEEKIFTLFCSLDLPMTIGVIPNRSKQASDPNNKMFYPVEQDLRCVQLLNKGLEQGFQLALHGFTHQTCSNDIKTEFAKQSYTRQLTKIKNGYDHLTRVFPGVPINVFIPPWDSFDCLTVDAMADMGIPILCGGQNIQAYNQDGVIVVPSCKIAGFVNYIRYYSLDNLVALVGDSWLVVTLHAYEFVKTEQYSMVSFGEFSALLHDICTRSIPVDVFPKRMDFHAFVPKQERQLWAMLDLFSKASTGPGKCIFTVAQVIKRVFGQPFEAGVLYFTASVLQAMKRIRDRLRRRPGSGQAFTCTSQ
jgi:predicted deacetylase